jgi:hypothetical protein
MQENITGEKVNVFDVTGGCFFTIINLPWIILIFVEV